MKPLHIRQAEKIVTDWERENRRALKASRPAKVATGGGKLSGEAGSPTLRKAIPDAWKVAALDRQQWLCAKCGSRVGQYNPGEFDHVIAIALGGSHDCSNIEILCARPCHLEKTKLDVSRIAKAKRQSKLLQPREPSKHRLRSRGFS